MKTASTLLALVGSAFVVLSLAEASPMDDLHWHLFKRQHGKRYDSLEEELMRKSIFVTNKAKIEHHNRHSSRGYKKGLSHLSDWTEAETRRMLGFRPSSPLKATGERKLDEAIVKILADPSPVPREVNWRKVAGRVSEVKDQGRCGSCWAFATTGVLEGQEAVRNITRSGQVISLSEQELIDCSKSNNGCDGGSLEFALADVAKLGGVEDEASYPYETRDKLRCRFNKRKSVMTDRGSMDLDGTEEGLKKVVARMGPVAVAIEATKNLFGYEKGVFRDPECSLQANHAVLVVGYGTDPKEGDYWIIVSSSRIKIKSFPCTPLCPLSTPTLTN